ncbi:MAG: sugar-binding protein, partial [Gemmatimonadota bacterium]
AAAAHAQPEAAAAVRQGEVVLDGRADEAAWGRAAWSGGFVSASDAAAAAGAPRPAAVQTRFKVLYDADALYVAVECDEPSLDQLRARYTAQDQEVYADDSVELFLDPAGEGRYYHQFVVNSNGAWYDSYTADYGLAHAKLWDCPLQVGAAVERAAGQWRVEVRIPLAGLQLGADAGDNWLWNVARERHAGGQLELTTWAPLKGNFHLPRLFGRLTGVAVDYAPFRVTLAEPEVAVGGNSGATRPVGLTVPVTNSGPSARRLSLSVRPFAAPGSRVQGPVVEVPAGTTVRLAAPDLPVPAAAAQLRAELGVTDAASGRWARLEVKRLNVEYVPVALTVRQPVYRDNIYPTETVDEIRFGAALAPDVAARAARVLCRLAGPDGSLARPGSEIAVALVHLDQELRLPAAGLPEGTYALEVRAVDGHGKELARAVRSIRKLGPAPGVEVRVDDRGSILVNGVPRVFIGWYGNVPLEDPRPEVVALQDLVTPAVLGGTAPEHLEALREQYAQRGIGAIVSIEPGRLWSTFRLWERPEGAALRDEIETRTGPSPEMRQLLEQLVAAVAAEPGVLGYYLADEPEINDARAEYLEGVYRLMQELDPYRPVMITNDTMDGIVTHGYRACDILSPDPYSPAWEYVPAFMERARQVRRQGQALAMTPWTASSQTHFDRQMGSDPPYPYAVMRHQWLTALAMGARAFTGYTDAFFLAEPRLRYGLPPIWQEIRFLEAATGDTGEPPAVKADAAMVSWLGRANGQVYLIVSNYRPGARPARVSHALLDGVQSLYVVGEGREVAVAGGAFADDFGEGAVRVYTTDPAGQRLPVTAAVAAEVARQEEACLRPGNLLHWSRGVRASSGPGYYAPWFTQYYYYAINGIDDDRGWQLSHTDGSCTLELRLPSPERVGRVVLHVDDLRDYDLGLRGADGAEYRVEVRGNEAAEVVHRFASPVAVESVAVTALASTDGPGARGAAVQEIEAYADPGAGPVTPLERR